MLLSPIEKKSKKISGGSILRKTAINFGAHFSNVMIWVLCEIESRICIGVVISTIEKGTNSKCQIAVMHIYSNEPHAELHKILLKRIKLLPQDFAASIIPYLQQQRNYPNVNVNHIEKFSELILPLANEAKISQSIIAKLEVKTLVEIPPPPPTYKLAPILPPLTTSSSSSDSEIPTVIRIPKNKLPQPSTYKQAFGVKSSKNFFISTTTTTDKKNFFNFVNELSHKKNSNKKQLKNQVKLYLRNSSKIDLHKLRTLCCDAKFTAFNSKVLRTFLQRIKRELLQKTSIPNSIEIKKSPIHGNGAFAKNEIQSDVRIDFVQGKIIDKNEDCNPIYALSVPNGTLLMENWTRFINGCSKKDEANVEFITTVIDGRNQIAVNSIKLIEKDTELLVYYGQQYTRFFDIN